ncbi:MAG: hypothetical protein PHG61_04375 [Candidatus Marinimicrobia bacterium]|jgi:hypothetical protein|nr:hypothetical protein [Candidatus Neomarinimicrobiota bacterium]
MAITTTLSIDHLEFSIMHIIYEWLTDTDCFDAKSSTARKADISATIKQYDTGLTLPQVNINIVPIGVRSTGAGQLNARKEFRTYNIQIHIVTDKHAPGYADDIGGVQLGDILMKYYRNATKGSYALAVAGLKKNRLFGPFPSDDKRYYYRDYFLRFEAEI